MIVKISDRLTFEEAKNLFNKELVKFNIIKSDDGSVLVNNIEFDEKDKDNIVNRNYLNQIENKNVAAGTLFRNNLLTIGENNLWYLVGESDYIFVKGNSVERSVDEYFRNLDVINEKSDPNLPMGVRQRLARAISKYSLPLGLVNGFGLKEDSQAHAAYLIDQNKITIVPEYFIRMGVMKIGNKFLDEFSKTVIHEFGHVIWHQLLDDKVKLVYEQDIAPKYYNEEEYNQSIIGGIDGSKFEKGYTDTLSGKRIFGEYWTKKDDKFLSSYARMSIKEDFAEAFLYYMMAPDFLMGFDEKRYGFIKSLKIDNPIVAKGELILSGKQEPVQISDLITIDLQTSELRRKLSAEFESTLNKLMGLNNIKLEQIKNVIPYSSYVSVGEDFPEDIKIVIFAEKLIGDKNIIEGNAEITIVDKQEKADKIIYNQRINVEDTKVEPTEEEIKGFNKLCENLDIEEFDNEIRINKRYYKKEEIDHWITTPNGARIPIPKKGVKGYKKIKSKQSKAGRKLLAIKAGKVKPQTLKEVKQEREKIKLPLGHIERKSLKISVKRKFSPIESYYSVQRHYSERAPEHNDLRLKMGNKAYSWAVPKWPNSGERQLAVMQPAHSVEYMKFKGTIQSGQYGSGRVDLMAHDKVDITDWGKKKIAFNVYRGKNSGRYALIDIGDKNFLLIRKKQIREFPKIEYTPARARIKFKESMWKSPRYVIQAKMNGARYLLYVGQKHNQLLSRSMSVKNLEHHVDQTDNVPHIRDLNFEHKDLVLDGEIFRKDKYITSAMMNSSPIKSRELQKKHGKLMYYVFDILRYNGNDLRNLPYSTRLKFLERAIGNKYPGIRIIPSFSKNKKAYYRRLIKMGYEGIVMKDLDGKYNDRFMTKFKPVFDEDYVLMDYTPGKGKYRGLFGALIYGKYKNGKLVKVGKVGSGFTEKERIAINDKLKSLIKKKVVISIKHLGKTHKGTPEGPVFDRVRTSKTWHDMYAESIEH